VKTKARKIRVRKTKGRRKEKVGGKEKRGERIEKKKPKKERKMEVNKITEEWKI